MDFKSLISKLDSMDAPPKTPAAPIIDRAVQLNEDAQLRVLAGQTTYVSEAKKKKDEEVKEEMKTGDKKPSSTGGTIEKVDDKTIRHHAGKNYGGSKAEVDDDEDDKPKKKAKKESVEPEFKSKFMKMVEAKKEEAADKKKADKKKKMEEGAMPDHPDVDGDKNTKEPITKAAADKKAGNKGDDETNDNADSKGLSAKQKKLPPGLQKAIASKTESKMMPKGKKRPVKESVETKLSFKQMVQLVQESGGQQQIDPLDKSLFNWATRVATSKLGESMKAELYAGLIYERNGGTFEMYDVLSEAQK